MGINGLLQALKPIVKPVHVSKYGGQRAAVDGYSWLHKGAYCCARELCEGVWTDRWGGRCSRSQQQPRQQLHAAVVRVLHNCRRCRLLRADTPALAARCCCCPAAT
jgi:hypothetical protein